MLPQTQEVERLTTEILILKGQAATNIIEIGKRLIRVKESLQHGEWGKWLEEKVEFGERTAQRFMQIASEFSNTSAMTDLPPTKIFALLDLPPEEREPFIQSNPVDEMTTRELQAAIRAKKDAERRAKQAEEEADGLVAEVQRLNQQLTKTNKPQVIEKEVIPESVKTQLEKSAEELGKLRNQKQDLENQIKAITADPEQERINRESKASVFTGRINNFLKEMGSLPYIGEEVIKATPYTRQEYEKALSRLEKWTDEMRIMLGSISDGSQIIDAEVIESD